MESYRDKVVVITGGATGIGFSFAKRFGADGAKLVIAGRRQGKVDEAVEALTDMGYQAAGKACDVSDLAQVEALADFAWERWGRADVLMNNAGIAQRPTPIIGTAPEDVERVMRTNYFGVWYGCHVFGRRFIEQGTPAAIYNVGSENSLQNFVFMAGTYEASKHALHAMTDAMREEVPDFIEVSFVLPGFVSSEMTDPFGKGLTMDTDRYTGIAFPQLKAGEFYVVSHAYNMKRINDRYEEISAAYAKYAPRYEGDEEFDARSLMAKIRARLEGIASAQAAIFAGGKRVPDALGVEILDGPFMSSALPIAGFALIEAAELADAIEKVSRVPCAVAHGVVEVWPLQEAP